MLHTEALIVAIRLGEMLSPVVLVSFHKEWFTCGLKPLAVLASAANTLALEINMNPSSVMPDLRLNSHGQPRSADFRNYKAKSVYSSIVDQRDNSITMIGRYKSV